MKKILVYTCLIMTTAQAFCLDTKGPRKPAAADDSSSPCREKKIVISNKYCTARVTTTGNSGPAQLGVMIHILDPRTSKEVNSDYVMNGVTEDQAMKLLDSATCQ